MMPRMSRRVDDVQKEFAEDFTVVNDNLLLCKVNYFIDKEIVIEFEFSNNPPI